MGVLSRPSARRLRRPGQALMTVLVTGAPSSGPPGRLRWMSSSTGKPLRPLSFRGPPWSATCARRPSRSSTRPASTSSRAASTATRTWSCRSAGRSPRTPSRAAPRRRPGAARPRSWTSPSRGSANASRTASPPGTARPTGNCAIDYGFHQIIGGVDDESLKAMDELVDEGITSFKLFMAYPGVFYSDDGQIVRAMQTAANNGAHDHDARRERHRHRRPRRSRRWLAGRPPRSTTG